MGVTKLIFDNDEIIHPTYLNEMHHEVELVLLIGNTIKNTNDEEAEDAIYGYAVGLDITLRDLQSELEEKGKEYFDFLVNSLCLYLEALEKRK